MEENVKIIKTKQDIFWSIAFHVLESLDNASCLVKDEGFRERFEVLFKYVEKKLALPYDGDWKDFYVVVEQEAIGDDYEKWLKDENRIV